MDDPELLHAYLENGSEPAFAALVDRYTGLVYSTALRQLGGNTHLARDVTQGVFTDLARKAAGLRNRPVLTGWLYTSTHHAVAETFRAEKRRKRREQEAHTMMQISSSDRPDNWNQLRPVLDDAMRELGDDDRDSILLRYFEGRPFAEIGAKLALSENAARMRVERALDKMHALLSKRGLTSSSAALAAMLVQEAIGATPAGLAAEISSSALAGAAYAAKPALHLLGSAKSAVATLGAVGAICAGILAALSFTNQRIRGRIDELQRSNPTAATLLNEHRQQLAQRTADLAAQRQLTAAILRLTATRTDSAPSAVERRLILRTRSAMALRYASLFRALKLAPPQQEQFEALLLRKSVAEVTALSELSSHSANDPTSINLPVINALKSAVTADIDTEIASLLGGERFQRYAEFARSLPVRQQVETIAAASKDTSAALNDDEIDGLTHFVARAADYTRPLPETLLAQARASLDVNQQAALDRVQAIRVARATILETNRSAAAKGLVQLPPLSGLELDTL